MNSDYSTYFQQFNPSLLVASLNVVAPNWGETECRYDYHKFYYFQAGEATLTINQTIFHPKKGELYLIPAGVTHSYCHNPDQPVYKYWCHFSISPSEVWHFRYHPDTLFCCPDPDCMIPLFEELIKTYQSNSRLASMKILYLLTKLCYEFFRMVDFTLLLGESKSSFYSIVNTYIKEHITEKILLCELADLTHLQKNYFISRFKKEFGSTPIDYINALRLEGVARYLGTQPAAGISEAALQFGFEDYRYFIRLFKQRYGITPSSFRKSIEGPRN
ncbi:AraC family transcriptional regulator [Anaerocolumna sp. AGMB13025]|uniref:helix-turn-helix domain-containing protein n=1 Tax=Anaerocolumna sp. AGMB13025 TaxID=3039116 RepID=UPI0024204D48|nr:AraC family transcriptional regulator [Anaerocolumna sp. AGMB13025]WFR58642.1 AraC family transcriptional regulator [Anaerocolumna sp. AGMB13025]